MKLKEKRGVEYNTVIYNIQWETENEDLPSEVQHDFFLENDENIEDEIYAFLMQLSNGVAPLGYQIEMNNEEYYYQPEEDYWEDEEVASESITSKDGMTVSEQGNSLNEATSSDLEEIGKDIASLYGGELLDYDELETGDVRFHCIEDGEEFITDLTKEEIENYWDNDDDDMDDPNYLNLKNYLKDIENTLNKKYPGLDDYYNWAGVDDEDMLKFSASTYNAENIKNTLNVIKTYFKKQNIPFATDVEVDSQQHIKILVLVNADQYDDDFLRDFNYKWLPKKKEESLTEDNYHPLAKKLGAKLLSPKEKAKPRYTYEVYWYDNEECDGDPIFKTFYSKKKAQEWYDAHCNDADKFCMDEPYGSRVDEAYSNKEIDRRLNQRQRYLNHLKQQENDVKIPWTVFTFEDGSNPYVVKTQKELDRMLKKYDDRLKQVGENAYKVLNKAEESIKESGNKKDSFVDIDGKKHYYTDYGVIKQNEYKNRTIVKDEDLDRYTIWSNKFCRPLSKFRDNNELEAIWFGTYDEVIKYIDKDSKDESLNEASSIKDFTPIEYDGINDLLLNATGLHNRAYCGIDKVGGKKVYFMAYNDGDNVMESTTKSEMYNNVSWLLEDIFYEDLTDAVRDAYYDEWEQAVQNDEDFDLVDSISDKSIKQLIKEFKDNDKVENIQQILSIGYYSLYPRKLKDDLYHYIDGEEVDEYVPVNHDFYATHNEKEIKAMEDKAKKLFGKKESVQIKEESTLNEARDYESEYNITPSDRRKIIQWWKDLKNYFDEYHTNYDLDLSTIDSDEIDGWFISMADELQDLVDEKQNDGALDLLRRGKSLYNKYAYGSFRYGVKESKESKEKLESGDCAYHRDKDEYFYLKEYKTNSNGNKCFELYTYNYGKFNLAHPRFIDENSPFYNQLVLKTKRAVPQWVSKNESLEESPRDLKEEIKVNDTLNPKLFQEDKKLKPEVKEKINNIVDEFLKGLQEDNININVTDIELVGSNVNYNYTKDSDLDVHIIADVTECPKELYGLLYSAYRSIWNKNIDIDFYGIPVELYVDIENNPKSNGIYSVTNDEWIKEPIKEDIPDYDKEEFEQKFKMFEDKYFMLIDGEDIKEELSNPKIEEINNFLEDIYNLRQQGLQQEGEYSIGNLVFKEFRNMGYLDNLKQLKNDLIGKDLSLEGLNQC